MRILLIEPPKPDRSLAGDDVFIYEPLALEYLAAGIPSEYEVQILDLRLEKDLESNLEKFQPDVVGITAYTIHVNQVKNLFEKIKNWNQSTLTVVGGHHATVLPDDFSTPDIDLIVIGEGVIPFNEILRRHRINNTFLGIPGVYDPNTMKPEDIKPQPQVNLDDLPFPKRSLTSEYRQQYYSDWLRPLASIRTSKGCPYRCSFCALWKLTGGKYLRRDPEKIVEELETIEEKWIFFADDESMLDTERMSHLAELIKINGIEKNYFLYARSDTIANNPELFKSWQEIGLRRVFVGLEFCEDDNLDFIGKKSYVIDNDRAVEILHALDIDIYASFIIRPDFSNADFKKLRAYCRQLELSFASFAVLTPLPGTDYYESVKDEMIINDYDLFDFIHTLLPTKLSLKSFYQQYHDLYIHGISIQNHLKHLNKYHWSEIPKNLLQGQRFYKRLRNTYRDYI